MIAVSAAAGPGHAGQIAQHARRIAHLAALCCAACTCHQVAICRLHHLTDIWSADLAPVAAVFVGAELGGVHAHMLWMGKWAGAETHVAPSSCIQALQRLAAQSAL